MNSIDTILSILKKLRNNKSYIKIELHEPFIDRSDFNYTTLALKTKQLSTYGKFTKIFENKLQKCFKTQNLICLSSGTAALHLSLKVLDINKNHEVFVSPLTYISTVNAIRYCNAQPHFFDVDKNNLSIDISKFKDYLKKNTKIINKKCYSQSSKKQIKALIVTHVNGLCCEIDVLKKICKANHILLVEDAAESLGCKYKNIPLGCFGDVGIVSFNGNKVITTGGGGAIIFKSKKKLNLAHHLSTNSKIFKKNDVIHDRVGYNYRLPSLNAALGISQLKKLNFFLKQKKKLHNFYVKNFKNTDYILLQPSQYTHSNYWLNTLLLTNQIKHKNLIISELKKKNINVRPIWRPIHYLKHFKNCPRMNLENTVYIYKRAICLPSSVFLIK